MWLTLKYFLGLFLRLSYWWARDYIWTDLCLALIKHFTEGNYIKQWSRREMVLPWAKIKNNHLQLFIFFFFPCFCVLARVGKHYPAANSCWFLCSPEGGGAALSVAGEEQIWEWSFLCRTLWRRWPDKGKHKPVCSEFPSQFSFLHPLQQNSKHGNRPASGEMKYILFAVNWYQCFVCGICYFHSKLVAVLKNSLMIMYISAVLIWLVFHCCSNSEEWLVYIECGIIFTMRIVPVWETIKQKRTKLPYIIGFNSIYHTLIDMRILNFPFFFFLELQQQLFCLNNSKRSHKCFLYTFSWFFFFFGSCFWSIK